MCGIAGIFAYGSDAAAVDRGELLRIRDRMSVRGPDAEGLWISDDARVGLAHRRLSIIDLSPAGTQPMWDAAGELAIVFNGEIYNWAELRRRLERRGYPFRTHSDTEVILQLYRDCGPDAVELMRGMFAFAIWDTRDRSLFLARDAYGIKPLYYADDGRTIRFASQVKALLAGGAVSRTADPAGEAGFFLLGSVPSPWTAYESIRGLEAGSWMAVRAGRGEVQSKAWFSIASIYRRAAEQESYAELVDPRVALQEAVGESVRYHLVADVPVGAFLSAGLDSTTLATLAAATTPHPLRTVTLTWDFAYGTADDEGADAAAVAARVGAQHESRVMTRDDFTAELPRIFDAMDQPSIDGANTWFVSRAAADAGLKVAISGIGGDELFGSYPSFRSVPRMVAIANGAPRGMRRRLLRAALRAGVKSGRVSPKSLAIPTYGSTWRGAWFLQRGLYLPEDLGTVMSAADAQEGIERLHASGLLRGDVDPDPRNAYGRVATLESTLYLRNQLLRDTDWASMAHSLEVRTPLVDAWLLRQLAPMLLRQRARTKELFAGIADPPLPDAVLRRKKQGFQFPYARWFDLPPDGTPHRMRSWARVVWEESRR